MKRLWVYAVVLSTTLWSDDYLGRWQMAYHASQQTTLSQSFTTSELSIQKGFSTFGNGFGEFNLELRHLLDTEVTLGAPYATHQLGYSATSLGINMDHVRPDGILVGLGVGYRMDRLKDTYRPTPTSTVVSSSNYKTPVANVHVGYRFSSVMFGLRFEKNLSSDASHPIHRFSPSRSLGAFISYTF